MDLQPPVAYSRHHQCAPESKVTRTVRIRHDLGLEPEAFKPMLTAKPFGDFHVTQPPSSVFEPTFGDREGPFTPLGFRAKGVLFVLKDGSGVAAFSGPCPSFVAA